MLPVTVDDFALMYKETSTFDISLSTCVVIHVVYVYVCVMYFSRYWNQYADETYVQFAEAKIWTTNSPVHMRYRQIVPTSSSSSTSTAPRDEEDEQQQQQQEGLGTPPVSPTSYSYVDSSVPCVSEQLAQALQQRFSMANTAPFRLVGHSLGSQLVIRASTLLSQRSQDDPSIRYVT
jgi:hypothetical protein